MTDTRPAIVITRAQPGAAETAARVAMEGWRPILSPALDIKLASNLPDLTFSGAINGLIFTSANGVRAFARVNDVRTVTAWCVGPATTRCAEALDFVDVRNADGNADDLVGLIKAEAEPGARLLHVANDAAAGEVAARLNAAGFEVEFWPLYSAVETDNLTGEARDAFQRPSAVLIHSAKGAAAFMKLTRDLDLSQVIAVCVSAKASVPLDALALKATYIAKRPNEDALMAALGDAKLAL